MINPRTTLSAMAMGKRRLRAKHASMWVATSIETLIEAAEQVETVVPDGEIKEVVADKGYHSNQVMVDLERSACGVISEPDRGRRKWEDNPEARDAVYRNGGGFAVHAGSGSCGSAVSASNDPSPISTKPVGCVACTSAATPTFGSGYWFTPAASISACSCDS